MDIKKIIEIETLINSAKFIMISRLRIDGNEQLFKQSSIDKQIKNICNEIDTIYLNFCKILKQESQEHHKFYIDYFNHYLCERLKKEDILFTVHDYDFYSFCRKNLA